MKIKKLLFFILIISASIKIKAQTINCNSFCITNITMDTIGANTLNITIAMGGSGSDFINYPYVSTVINSVGDTIATGGMQFFGQIGGTSQTYTIATSADSLGTNFTGTIYFTYDSVVCALPYPCVPQGLNEETILNETKIYPNPSDGKFSVSNEKLNSKDFEVIIFNSLGEKIYSEKYLNPGKINEVDLSAFPKGLYFVSISNGNDVLRRKIVID